MVFITLNNPYLTLINYLECPESCNEEYIRISTELEDLRSQRAEFDKQNNIGNDYRARLSVIIETLNSWQGLLVKFSDEIFNALVEKIEIISPSHFVFVLKSGMRMEETFI